MSWAIISKQTYAIRKYHRVTIDSTGLVTWKCNTWSPHRTTFNSVSKWGEWRIDSKGEEKIEISEKQLCGICFSQPRKPKVPVTALYGRI